MHDLAVGHHLARNLSRAESVLEEAVRLWEARPESRGVICHVMNYLGHVYWDGGRRAEALALHERALRLLRDGVGRDATSTLQSGHFLAQRYREAGNPGRAVELLEESLPRSRARLGPDAPNTAAARNDLAALYQSLGRWQDAIPLIEEGLAREKPGPGPDAAGVAEYRARLLDLCARQRTRHGVIARTRLVAVLLGQARVEAHGGRLASAAALRGEALEQARDELRALSTGAGADSPVRAEAARQTREWLTHPEYASVRSPLPLAVLPEGERRLWVAFWRDVRAVHRGTE
jgi:tetratricopeptide (TPR) repeat protein